MLKQNVYKIQRKVKKLLKKEFDCADLEFEIDSLTVDSFEGKVVGYKIAYQYWTALDGNSPWERGKIESIPASFSKILPELITWNILNQED